MVGQTISHYRILSRLGEGGMGDVYKAEDLKLNRTVALKFLPGELTSDPEAVHRFINEAQLASALEHSNICRVYEIDETDPGQMYICMAYYDGETLESKIREGALRVEEAVDIARQVARGLEQVHEAGIVHRDLKPTNILITRSGEAKILDFGIAKLAGSSRLTRTGTTLGTLAYMSPEQVEKGRVDHRADIWSLGVVLYEMLAGRLPFQNDNDAALVYSIVNEPPESVEKQRQEISIGLQRILGKALDKDPETRYQSVIEFLQDLDLERRGQYKRIKSPARVRKGRSSLRVGRLVGYSLALVMLVAFVLYLFRRHTAEEIVPTYEQITYSGDTGYANISPDGRFVAYLEGKRGDQSLNVLEIANGHSNEVVSGIKVLTSMQWSPNSAELALNGWFRDLENGTHTVSRLGGSPHRISAGVFLTWSPDGAYIAGAAMNSKGIRVTDTGTGNLTTNIPIDGPYRFLDGMKWSPRSDRILFVTRDDEASAIWTIKIDGSEMRKVVEDRYKLTSPQWGARAGSIYYFRVIGRTKQLTKVNVSLATGEAVGRPRILQNGMEADGMFSLSWDNRKLAYTRQLRYSNLFLRSLADGSREDSSDQPRQLTTGTLAYFTPSISPDGSKVAFSRAKGQVANIFVMPMEGGQMKQLTFMDSYSSGPSWSPDGREIAFGSLEADQTRVWKVDATGGDPKRFQKSKVSSYDPNLIWSPGRDILYHRPGHRNFYLLDAETGKERPLVRNEAVGWIFTPVYSPDGKDVAVLWNRPSIRSPNGLWYISLEDSSQTFLYNGDLDLKLIAWSNDGRWLYAWTWLKRPIEVVKVPVDGGKIESVVVISADEIDGISISPDGKKLVYAAVKGRSDVWVMKNFDPENELEAPVSMPDRPEYRQLTYLEEGDELMRQKKYVEAEETFRAGLELGPNNMMLLNGLGWSLQHQKRYSEAEMIFRKGVTFRPEYRTTLNGIRLAAFQNKNYPDAKRYNQLLLERETRPKAKVLIRIQLAAIDLIMKDYTGTEKELHSALSIDSTNAQAYRQLGYLFAEQDRYAEAEVYGKRALALDSSYASYNLMAWILIAGDLDIERGISFAEKALSAKPENWAETADVYSYLAIPEHSLGLGYLKRGVNEKAVHYLEQAAEFAPGREEIKDDLDLSREELEQILR